MLYGSGITWIILIAVIIFGIVAMLRRTPPNPRWANREFTKDDIPFLLEKMKSSVSNERYYAAHKLGLLGQDAAVAVPNLIQMLNETEWLNRMSATFALGGIGPAAKDAVPALLGLGRTGNKRDITHVISALRTIGVFPGVLEFVMKYIEEDIDTYDPSLPKNMQEFPGTYKLSASNTLMVFGADAVELLPRLIAQVKREKDKTARGTMILAVGSIGKHAKNVDEVVDFLIEILDKSSGREAMTALAMIGRPAASKAVPHLLAKFHDPGVNVEAMKAAGNLSNNQEVISALIEQLESGDDYTVETAAETLARLGKPAAVAIPSLMRLQDSGKPSFAAVATYALYKLDGRKDEDLRRLIGFLKEKDPQIRMNVSYYLGKIGPDASEAIPLLRVAAKDKDALKGDLFLSAKYAIDNIEGTWDPDQRNPIMRAFPDYDQNFD